jgi:membrane protein DedA with SNARE-associated domain
MNSIDLFLVQYGLAAIFIILLAKSMGVPIPVPADVIILVAAARAADGKFVLWQAFLVILFAVILGGLIQFMLVRGPGRNLLYRFGRYIGLTTARLDAASVKIKKGGVFALSVAILVPGVRGAAIAASGLADFRLRTFVPGLVIGSTLFLTLHFLLGYLGGSLFLVTAHLLPSTFVIIVALILLVLVYLLWVAAVRRQKAARRRDQEIGEEIGAALEVWHEGICPVCLALYTANQLRPLSLELPL